LKQVRNISGTSSPRYADSNSKTSESWLQTWRDATGSDRATCCVNECNNLATQGAHVQMEDHRMTRDWYLVPMCSPCNSPRNSDGMYIDCRVVPVAVNPLNRGT
jgi:hypothetical protein